MSEFSAQNLGLTIKYLRKKKGLSQDKLAKELGITKISVYQWEAGKFQPSYHILVALSKVLQFNLLIPDLTFPDKKMTEADVDKIFNLENNANESQLDSRGNEFIDLGNGFIQMTIDLVEPYAAASFIQQYFDESSFEPTTKHSIIIDREHKGNYKAFRTRGDSMDDGSIESIPDGIIVTGCEISRDEWKFGFNTKKRKNYIFVTKEGIYIKQISKQDLNKGVLTLHSINPNKKSYPDFEVNLDDVLDIFYVYERSLR